jgi:hypothetical protein
LLQFLLTSILKSYPHTFIAFFMFGKYVVGNGCKNVHTLLIYPS